MVLRQRLYAAYRRQVDQRTRVPREFVRDGQIVLNLGSGATNKLQIGNEFVEFQARFGGVARELVGADSTGCGNLCSRERRRHGFDLEEEAAFAGESVDAPEAGSEPDPEPPRPEPGRPKLQRIK
jgi:stringent starvation protein B